MMLSNKESDSSAPAKRSMERSTLSQAYAAFAIIAALGGAAAIVYGVVEANGPIIAGGVGGVVAAVLLMGLSEFFHQVTRITVATEETVRLLREQRH